MTQSVAVGPAVAAVTGLIGEPDPFLRSAEEVESLQLDALRERFAVGRVALPLIERRAQDGGVEEIKSLADVVPLLFAHSTYKTYDERIIERGQWERLLRWYASLSMVDVRDTDIEGVAGIDEFIDRLHAAGHYTMITGGTGGKCSFFNQTGRDRDLHDEQLAYYFGWPAVQIPITNERVVFQLAPVIGPTRFHESFRGRKRAFARDGMAFGYGDIEVKASDLNRLGRLRRSMADGLTSPDELAAFDRESAERAELGNHAVRECVERLFQYRDEPLVVSGSSREYLRVLLIADEMGLTGGCFHPDSVFSMGGGFKGGRAAWGSDMTVPADAREQIFRFLSEGNVLEVYGMSEISTALPKCEAGSYHRPAWTVFLPLDESGEELLEVPTNGDSITARMAFFDLTLEGRWGGIITGDRATVRGTCECGRPGPVIDDPVERFADVVGDDKITCAGTIESYLRGFSGDN